MPSTAKKRTYTHSEYVKLEQTSEVKHEFYMGEIFDMSPGVTIDHGRIVANTGNQIFSFLKEKKCTVVTNDVRVRIDEIDFDAYPDIVVFCEEEERKDEIRKPVIIIEVLSKSTRDYDRGQKFELFRYAKSLKEYVVIDQYQILIEQFVKNNSEWILKEYRELETSLSLATFELSLKLSDIYQDVKF